MQQLLPSDQQQQHQQQPQAAGACEVQTEAASGADVSVAAAAEQHKILHGEYAESSDVREPLQQHYHPPQESRSQSVESPQPEAAQQQRALPPQQSQHKGRDTVRNRQGFQGSSQAVSSCRGRGGKIHRSSAPDCGSAAAAAVPATVALAPDSSQCRDGYCGGHAETVKVPRSSATSSTAPLPRQRDMQQEEALDRRIQAISANNREVEKRHRIVRLPVGLRRSSLVINLSEPLARKGAGAFRVSPRPRLLGLSPLPVGCSPALAAAAVANTGWKQRQLLWTLWDMILQQTQRRRLPLHLPVVGLLGRALAAGQGSVREFTSRTRLELQMVPPTPPGGFREKRRILKQTAGITNIGSSNIRNLAGQQLRHPPVQTSPLRQRAVLQGAFPAWTVKAGAALKPQTRERRAKQSGHRRHDPSQHQQQSHGAEGPRTTAATSAWRPQGASKASRGLSQIHGVSAITHQSDGVIGASGADLPLAPMELSVPPVSAAADEE
ncbi:hypothetical protein cyc_00704 [Cyclospora cayetanensis]|uniref:Uncharacterized protein n=1 Tax=Cyclospora cayetanensis TaxID=88456 RepID=A0A1D3CRD8_9EIME|nr:hypothetical protein cyc_00704 [Cyclospora cayetanensis]